MTTKNEAALFQERMLELVRAFGWHRPERTPCGKAVPISEAHALMELARSTQLSQAELGERLALEKSTVSRLLGQLQARGWVVRARTADDGRVSVVSLSETGLRAADQLAAARAAFLGRVLERIPKTKRRDLLDCLLVLLEGVREEH